MFEVIERSGLGRIGSWTATDRLQGVKTPNVIFIASDGIRPPAEAEVIISEKETTGDKTTILSAPGLFSGVIEEVSGLSVSPHLFFPPSQKELNRYAAEINRENASSRVFVVAGRDEDVAEAVKGIEAEIFVMANAMHLLARPREFVNTIVHLRQAVGYQSMIYTPGLGAPSHLAALVYLGIDLFDSVTSVLNARLGSYLTTLGVIHKDAISDGFCFCPACVTGNRDYQSILDHNYYAALSELGTVRSAIPRWRLRELVETRVVAEPRMTSLLRIFDLHHFTFQERHLPVTGGEMTACSGASLLRPEIVRFRNRVKERYLKPPHKKVLLLLPCSAKKPYSFSRSHKAFRNAVQGCGNQNVVHEVVITSPLGVVPRELELFYPAQQYDIPVTRNWREDEKAMIGGCLASFFENNTYEHIIAHLPQDYMFIQEQLGEFTHTCHDSPGSRESQENLKTELARAVKPFERVGRTHDSREAMKCLARFQFGTAGESLLDNSVLKGRYPKVRIISNGTQVGMLVGERGMISLTLEGGAILAGHETLRVAISDFEPKGNIFAVGVENCDDNVRIGDDVVVLRDGEIVGVGVAEMSPNEMIESNRGEAVRIRHLRKSV